MGTWKATAICTKMASADRHLRGLRPYLAEQQECAETQGDPGKVFPQGEYAEQAEEARKAKAAGKSDYANSTDDFR
ncbi:hypothetical protein UNSWDHB_6 [Dehalobacter sp. UNSWDHB]|uniref:hypothetical protein n=1 Tax=unclassified Dehalobacter TaxID=2635733 RepID=UPI00028B39E8|nr:MULTISPECIES: hypothetical protein [unclassified Dehalobacter]AFV05710.1 hypothetical protein DCF50_p1708 [Dehalobacter sp. CF]EQB22662.1 hypothetical protein UNSWDHB_6 [Dehalobacter sp. UNSWDHB]